MCISNFSGVGLAQSGSNLVLSFGFDKGQGECIFYIVRIAVVRGHSCQRRWSGMPGRRHRHPPRRSSRGSSRGGVRSRSHVILVEVVVVEVVVVVAVVVVFVVVVVVSMS